MPVLRFFVFPISHRTIILQARSARSIDLTIFELQNWRALLQNIATDLVGIDSVVPDFVMAVWTAFSAHSIP